MQQDPKQRKRDRAGLTLIELLVTISVMATVTGMFVVAYRGAAVEANNIRTQSTIRKINEVLVSRIQEYEQFRIEPRAIVSGFQTRAIPGDARAIILPSPPNPNQESTALLLERARLFSLRQTMVQELPDHPDDLKWTTSWYSGGPIEAYLQSWLRYSHFFPTGLIQPGPSPSQLYAVADISGRTRQLIRKLSVVDPKSGALSPIPGWEARNANAELLYLIVEDSSYNGSSAIELFGRSEIRDTDGDGLNEFVDSYGNPIRWIRWPSGADISIRSHPDLMDPVFSGLDSNGNLIRLDVQGDPLDRSIADPGYAPYSSFSQLIGLRPLIVSPGLDKRFGVRMQLENPITLDNPFPSNASSYSVGDVPTGTSLLPDLPYRPAAQRCFIADPWYPRDQPLLRLGAVRTNTSRAPFDPNIPLESDYYDVAQDATDNISNLETGGGAL